MNITSSRRPARLRLLCVALATAFVANTVSAETINASGLRAPGSIGFDAEGVPLIQAANDYDAAFLMGYVHARDRLWQMDYLRRAASPSSTPTAAKCLIRLGLGSGNCHYAGLRRRSGGRALAGSGRAA